MIILKTDKEILLMREAAKAAFEIHIALSSFIRPGISTKDIERKAIELMNNLGVKSAYKGYRGFPAAAYTDINGGICHSLPSDKIHI